MALLAIFCHVFELPAIVILQLLSMFLSALFTHCSTVRMRKENVIENITCGEISDLLILLDSLIEGDIKASSLLRRIDLRNMESCIKSWRAFRLVL